MGSEDVSIYNSTALEEALSSTKKILIPGFLCPRPTGLCIFFLQSSISLQFDTYSYIVA